MRHVETKSSTLVWSADGSTVTKTRHGCDDGRSRFRNERRVSRLVTTLPPLVPTAKLLAHDTQRRRLTFEALPGEPLGPKYPTDITIDQVDALIDVVDRLRPYRPRRRWFRRLDSHARIARARRVGLVDDAQAARLTEVARRAHTELRFAHGDVTARNVVESAGARALIDWEWAGLYPPAYDRAFLWFSMVDAEGARARVEKTVDVDEPCFLLNALLIQLWHLELFVPAEFRAKHMHTRDDLLARLGC